MGIKQIHWGDNSENVLDLPYLDNIRTSGRDMPGYERVRGPGARDVWDTGTDFVLSGSMRWIPLEDQTDPAVISGLTGPLGVNEFIIWAKKWGNTFRYVPDSDLPDFYVPSCTLEAPLQPVDGLEDDGTTNLPITISNETYDFGLLNRGIFLAYEPGGAIRDWTHSRSLAGLYVDKDGVVQSSTGLRDHHYPVSGTRTTLLELASTNLFLHSRSFNNAAWVNGGGVTVTADDIAGPDGTTSADKLDFATTSSTNFLRQTYVIADPETRTFVFSVDIKDGTLTEAGNELQVNIRRGDSSDSTSYNVTGGGLKVLERLGDGWTRWYAVKTFSSSTTGDDVQVLVRNQSSTGYFYVDNAQLEELSYPTSRIITTTATVTRDVDRMSVAWPWKPQAMWVYLKAKELGSINVLGSRLLEFGLSSGARLQILTNTGSNFYRVTNSNGSSSATVTHTVAPVEGDEWELLVLLRANGSVELLQSVNAGAEVSTGTSGVLSFASAWVSEILWFNSTAGSSAGANGYESLKIGPGTEVNTIALARAK